MVAIINTKNLSRDFITGAEVVHAVKDVSIDVIEGQLTILRGRSGSGKTTLINLLGAMDMPSNGEIYFNDKDITKMSQKQRDELRRKNIGFVFQSGALISSLTAYENIEFGLRIAGYARKERGKRTDECLEMVGLSKRKMH